MLFAFTEFGYSLSIIIVNLSFREHDIYRISTRHAGCIQACPMNLSWAKIKIVNGHLYPSN